MEEFLKKKGPTGPTLALAAGPESAASPEPETQPAHDPADDTEALAEQNRSLRRKLGEAVRVANGCYHALERKNAEAGETERKLRWALLLERSAHAQTKSNPKGIQLSPTAEEVQERLAKEEERQKQAEHRRQAAIEESLKRALLKRIELEQEVKRRDKEAKEEQARRDRCRARSDQAWPATWAAAKALAVSRGHEEPTRADLKDALNGVCPGHVCRQ
jgi:hypothetical protein